MCIYPTAPFVKETDLINALDIMKSNLNAVQLIPMVKYSYPPQRSYVINDEGEAIFKYPEYITARSQDLEKMYHDVGQFYCYNVKKFQEVNGLVYDNIVPYLVDEMSSQDIDTEKDWKIAELKYRLLNKQL